MKAIKLLLALLMLTTGLVKAQFTKAELQVSGLTCALCARSTERDLKNLPFVSDVKPDLIRNLFIITFKSGEPVNFDEISKSVHAAGFFVNSLKATIDFDAVKVADGHFNYGSDTYRLINTDNKTFAGETTVTVVDKGFAPRSVSKKYLGQLTEPAPAGNGRIYHLAI